MIDWEERVAKAICKAVHGHEAIWTVYKCEAEAAIRAMRPDPLVPVPNSGPLP